jgi:hypothetical protein
MTYTFKLARRLAILRHLVVLTVLALLLACEKDLTAPEGGSSASVATTATSLQVFPRRVTIQTSQRLQFRAQGRTTARQTMVAAVSWTASGGSISSDGIFSSAVAGTYKVIGRGRWKHADTSVVVVVPPPVDLVSIAVAPGSTTLDTGATRTFTATGYLSDGSTAPVGVVWSASGGNVDPSGAYTAGSTTGKYRIIAKSASGVLSDTSSITITEPAPVLTSVVITPASVSLSAGASKQFQAYGRTSAGDSVATVATFSATGGTITSAGLYTAGNTGGTFSVKASANGLQASATVTIAASAPAPEPPSGGDGASVFGPYGLWASSTTLNAYAGAFTVSLNPDDVSTIVTRINAARTKGQKLVVNMTACCRTEYLTNGSFDLAKWKARQDRYNTSTIRSAIAAGVADGTVIGAKLIDEPERSDWGTTFNKTVVDQMAAYTKAIFPTLPVGIAFGPPGFRWRTDQTFHTLDWIVYQYNWTVSGTTFAKGDAAGWRDAVLAQAKKDGVTPAFSLNILDGGIQAARDGLWNCSSTLTEGRGTYAPNCRMTAEQVRTWGRALAPAGCLMLMWRYDDAYMKRTDNQGAFADLAQVVAGQPAKSCRRAGL